MIQLTKLNRYRVKDTPYDNGDMGGAFSIPFEKNRIVLRVIATVGEGWDHVSVSLPYRCPSWEEMEHIKRMFFQPHETAMQLHVPHRDHINIHAFCLHLWRPLKGMDIPLPPKELV